mgnify:FL=1
MRDENPYLQRTTRNQENATLEATLGIEPRYRALQALA